MESLNVIYNLVDVLSENFGVIIWSVVAESEAK